MKQRKVITGTCTEGDRDPNSTGPCLHAQAWLLPPWSQAGERALQRDRNGQAWRFRFGQGDPVTTAFYRLRVHPMVPLLVNLLTVQLKISSNHIEKEQHVTKKCITGIELPRSCSTRQTTTVPSICGPLAAWFLNCTPSGRFFPAPVKSTSSSKSALC